MAVPLFTGKVIAVIWDFDQTLIPGYQQKPLFEEFRIDPSQFWKENEALVGYYAKQGVKVSEDSTYLHHLLTYAREGRMPGLTNAKLKELGARLEFYRGIPEFLKSASEHVQQDAKYQAHEITVEHYVVSTGLRQMILGSGVAPFVKDVWGCEFIENPAPPGFLQSDEDPNPSRSQISQVGYVIDNTTKTRAIWEINKGCNVDPKMNVNSTIAPEDRRVPLKNMLYVADGPSDIPVFSILNHNGGRTLGVYNPDDEEHFLRVKALSDHARVQHFVEADYRSGRPASRWILQSLHEMAEQIVEARNRAFSDRVQPPSGHVV